MTNPRNYDVQELMRDGRSIRIRAIRAEDKQRLTAHFFRLSDQSKYFRFFGLKRDLTDRDLVRLTELDFVRCVGLVATLGKDDEEFLLGVGRYVRNTFYSSRAELAFAVLDEYQGLGVGTLLLEHLTRIARASGIDRFDAEVMSTNTRMLEVFAHSGFDVHSSMDDGVVFVTFRIRPADIPPRPTI